MIIMTSGKLEENDSTDTTGDSVSRERSQLCRGLREVKYEDRRVPLNLAPWRTWRTLPRAVLMEDRGDFQIGVGWRVGV